VSSLIEKTNAVHRISTAYHPQTNGLVERFNQTIQQMILKICNEDQNDWDIFLPECYFHIEQGKPIVRKFLSKDDAIVSAFLSGIAIASGHFVK
jgi:transposase InsO family protein